MQKQFDLKRKKDKTLVGPDVAASFLLYGGEGEIRQQPATDVTVTADHNAMTRRAGAWFTCLSAYHTCVSDSRWIQDRQNLVSLFHEKTGLIIGGGNTKLQPLFSTFTVGDVHLLSYKPGDENPNFLPPGELVHAPTDAKLSADASALELNYGGVKCRVA